MIDGAIYVTGSNEYGQLGAAVTDNVSHFTLVDNSHGFTRIAAGGFQSFAQYSDKQVLSWGENDKGQLGIGGSSDYSSAALVSGLNSEEVILDIAVGLDHALLLTKESDQYRLRGAGSGDEHQFFGAPVGSSIFTVIEELAYPVDIGAGPFSSLYNHVGSAHATTNLISEGLDGSVETGSGSAK